MTSEKKGKKPGPEPERLKLDGDDWREAVRKALRDKEKPPKGEPSEGDENGEAKSG